jgi:hypothetical protein
VGPSQKHSETSPNRGLHFPLDYIKGQWSCEVIDFLIIGYRNLN